MPLLTQKTIEQNHQQFVQQQREQEMLALLLTMTLIFLLICFGAWFYRYRRQVAKAADSAVISGLSHAIMFNRKIQAKRKSLVDRANAKANEGPRSAE